MQLRRLPLSALGGTVASEAGALVPACIGYLFGVTIAGSHQLSEDTMRHLNRLADMADSFVESHLAAAIGVCTLAAVLWSAFK